MSAKTGESSPLNEIHSRVITDIHNLRSGTDDAKHSSTTSQGSAREYMWSTVHEFQVFIAKQISFLRRKRKESLS